MSQNKKKMIPRKELMKSRGWEEVSPGVYVAKNANKRSGTAKFREGKVKDWNSKFEKAKVQALEEIE